jgi:hypothetical protein
MDFSIVEPQDAERAHQWHLGFAAANQSILPRSEAQFRVLIADGYVWSASEERNYAGLAYCCPNQDATEWELGGLMVAVREAGHGIAAILARLALINILVKENPLSRGEKVIAHVLASNSAPRGLIERALRFRLVRRDSYPSKDLPGLPVNEHGMVEGDLFAMTNDSLSALADWCDSAPTVLKDGRRPLDIEFGEGFSFELFSVALRQMSL